MAETRKTIRLDVITPDAAVLSEDVDFVLVRALDGDLGIMPNHAPLIASLDIWPLFYDIDGRRSCLSVASGFLEVSNNVITVIAPAAERPEQIDIKRAEEARNRAKERLESHQAGIDVRRAEMAMKRALCRLDAVQRMTVNK